MGILDIWKAENGATKRVPRVVGFQVTLPIDYILEYIPRKTHTTGLCQCILFMSGFDGQLMMNGERDIALHVNLNYFTSTYSVIIIIQSD